MKARSYNSRPAVEALEGRSMMSTVAYGDFNNDGRVDKAAVTNSTTITVSLAKPDGSYAVSAILTAAKNLPVSGINVSDVNADGKLDIIAGGLTNNRFYSHTWLGNGNGTFGDRITEKSGHIPKWWV
jgi:VCBS repeat protein